MKNAILLTIIFLCIGPAYTRQISSSEVDNGIRILNKIKQQEISRTYLDSVVDYVYGSLYQDETFSTQDLERLLNDYHRLAFGKFPKGYYRIYYYLMLVENARFQNRYGEALFFSEKADGEILDYGDDFAYTADMYKAVFYNDSKLYTRTISEYEKSSNKAENVFLLARKKQLNTTVYTQLLDFMKFAMVAYTEEKDTAHAEKLIKQAGAVAKTVLEKDTLTTNRFAVASVLLEMKFAYYYTLLKDMDNTQKTINSYATLIHDSAYSASVDKGVYVEASAMKIKYFIQLGDTDSVKYYIQKYKEDSKQYGYGQSQTDYLEPESEMYARLGDFTNAYKAQKQMCSYYQQQYGQLRISDLDLMYTYIQADETRKDVLKLEEEKKQRNTVIYGILFLFLLVAVGFLYKLGRNKKKSEKVIENLRDTTRKQIAKLHTEKQSAIVDEQERLGRELHDGLAGTIAGCYQRLNFLMAEFQDDRTRGEIKTISNTIANIHSAIRNKSHELSDFKENFLDREYEEKIKILVDSAFPESHYKKELVIEKGVVQLVRKKYREDILYILQECFTNIVKHAKATEVAVIVSTSGQDILLQVSDNGVGIRNKKHSNSNKKLGLDSIRTRTEAISGTLALYVEGGTTIAIRFPSSKEGW
ncbi:MULTISPECIES: sensor histidine kinase [Chitinophagaceae]